MSSLQQRQPQRSPYQSTLLCLVVQVSFEIADCMVADYPEGRFDVIYSRDTILHIHDKLALFDR